MRKMKQEIEEAICNMDMEELYELHMRVDREIAHGERAIAEGFEA